MEDWCYGKMNKASRKTASCEATITTTNVPGLEVARRWGNGIWEMGVTNSQEV